MFEYYQQLILLLAHKFAVGRSLSAPLANKKPQFCANYTGADLVELAF
jgi:hypothetical protein